MMELNTTQSEALNIVLSGHNLLLQGAAGTGKTFLIKQIVRELRNKGKCVALTATTGIACCLYDSASTIHLWSGIGDGRHDVSEMRKVVESNVQYAEVRKRIKGTDVLVIDECSMVSKRLFESLNEVCKLKDPKHSFGGIQLILSGDFTQLPPVPNQLYGEEGEFCFQSNQFDNNLPHRVTLTEVRRQSEENLIKAIHEVANGNVTDDTESFIRALNRPLDTDVECIKLFARNEQVDEYNRNKIIAFPGQLYEFQSEDQGDQKHLNKILAPKTLWLKKGAPVMLLRNLSDKLVNGLRGRVLDIDENGPVVEFPSLSVKVPLEKLKFSVFSPSRNTDLAVRFQYPIKPSFAISIHKSQGLTLESLEIDCRQIFKPGQLGVALGRARTTNGLRVINFNAKLSVIPQPESVLNFLHKTSAKFQDDRSCCNNEPQRSEESSSKCADYFTVDDLSLIEEPVELAEQQPSSEEFDSEFDEVINMITETQSESVDLPSDLDLEAILNSIECKIVKTTMQYNTNNILTEIDSVKYTQFCKNEYAKLSTFIEELNVDPSKPVKSKLQTEFYSKAHAYQISAEFRMNCLTLFENVQFTEDHLHICFNISNQIRTYLLKKKAELFPLGNRKITERNVTNAAEARVRYVGGYCIAKVRYKYMQKKKSYMYKTDESSQALYDESVQAVNVLDALKVEEHYILATTKNPDSLLDTKRKQGHNRALTNISDDLFDFFQKLTEKCLELLIDENINKYGNSLFEELRAKLQGNSELNDFFTNVVHTCLITNEELDESTINQEFKATVVETIFNKIIKLYLMVMVNQFRKDLLEALNIEKKMAHRKQVRVSGKTTIRCQQSSTDDTERPSTSQEITKNIPKPTLQQKRKRKTKKTSEKSDEHTIGSSKDQEPEQKKIHGDQSDTETMENYEDDDAPCQVCHLNKNQAPLLIEWIKCDSCNGWLHRKCAGLQHHLRWKKFNQEGVDFKCKQCE